jgi:hypothetical protein
MMFGSFALQKYVTWLSFGQINFLWVLFFVGLGLFIDELPLLLRYGNNFLHWEQYTSIHSVVGVVIIVSIYLLLIMYNLD